MIRLRHKEMKKYSWHRLQTEFSEVLISHRCYTRLWNLSTPLQSSWKSRTATTRSILDQDTWTTYSNWLVEQYWKLQHGLSLHFNNWQENSYQKCLRHQKTASASVPSYSLPWSSSRISMRISLRVVHQDRGHQASCMTWLNSFRTVQILPPGSKAQQRRNQIK